MKAKTSLLVLGLFTIAGAVTVSCGGSSDSDDNTNTAGTSGTAGTSSKAGSSSSAAGTNNNTGGSSNNTGGTGNNNGGTNNGNNGGANDFPSFGGAGLDVPSCAAGTMTGSTCTPGSDQACQLNDTTYCGCQGTTWTCIDTGDLGAGGAGPALPQATCPANAQTGDACSNGPGLCAGQNCACGPNDQVTCVP